MKNANMIEMELTMLALRIATEGKQDGVSVMDIVRYHVGKLKKNVADQVAVALSENPAEYHSMVKQISEIL